MSRFLPALAAALLLSACAAPTAPGPVYAPAPDAKPALASPPSSLMTPHGY